MGPWIYYNVFWCLPEQLPGPLEHNHGEGAVCKMHQHIPHGICFVNFRLHNRRHDSLVTDTLDLQASSAVVTKIWSAACIPLGLIVSLTLRCTLCLK